MPLLLSRYCQWMAQFLRLWQSTHLVAWSQHGQGSQARRDRSAVGSIGSTIHRPTRKDARVHEFVVDPLLFVV